MSVLNNAISTFTNNKNNWGSVVSAGSTFLGNKLDSKGDSNEGQVVGGLISRLGESNPWGYAGGYLGMGLANKITGGTDGMTTTDRLLGSKGISGAAFGAAAAAGGPVGWGLAGAYALGSIINSATGKTTMKDSFNDFMNSGKLSNLDSAYYRDSSLDNLYDKKYGGFSHRAYKKAQAKLRRDQWEKATKLDINELANIGKTRAGMVDANYNNYLLNINGGYIPTQMGKHGLDVSRLLKSREIINKYKNSEKEIGKFQNGGTMNVIPEGALHARKHHMADDEHITKKGIPVVDTDGNQQAEIECNEIIFRKEVTDQLEKLRKEGSDEAAIEAGKLLAQEIVENTEDRTGLINTVVGEEEKLLTQQVPMAQKGIEIPKLSKEHFNEDLEEMKVPEKFDSFEDLLKYLRETGRESTEDYDLEKAYRDFEVFNDWLEEERKTPGKGHWKDKYKKPNHITYSNESILGDNPKENGGIWAKDGNGEDIFIVSPYLQKLHTLWEYLKYFEDEPISIMYDGVTYKTKKK